MEEIYKNVSSGNLEQQVCSSHSLSSLGYLFYITSLRNKHFEKDDDFPDYIHEILPFLILITIIEGCVAQFKKKPILRINDGIISLFQGQLEEIFNLFCRGLLYGIYIFVYRHCHLITIPLNSMWSWMFSFICAEFVYYWVHRMAHETSFIWATHQIHHSSEDFNTTTSLRLSFLNNLFMMILFLPLAFFVPPVHYIAHIQLLLIFQFCIHTELIGKLGLLEYVLNTPSHHRVHHGRNKYCIDKNYGAVLIIWDRLFGTFAEEKEKVVYGLTSNLNTFDALEIQFNFMLKVWRNIDIKKGLKYNLSVLFYGPGWSPGKPRLGDLNDIPEVSDTEQKYDLQLPTWCKIYTILHSVLNYLAFFEILDCSHVFPNTILAGFGIYQIFTVISISWLLAGRWQYAAWTELFRCISFCAVDLYILPLTRLSSSNFFFGDSFLFCLRVIFLFSALLWSLICIKKISIHSESLKSFLKDKKGSVLMKFYKIS